MKRYIKPELKIVDCHMEGTIMSASGDNPYWKGSWGEPETPEGCENAYWCGKD
jgi:hypothetical protein